VDKFVIEGGVALRGEVGTSTAKNSVLPLLAATLLTREPCRILDVPRLSDVGTMLRILQQLGVECRHEEDGSVTARVTDESSSEAPYELVRTMRASVCVLGPLLGKRRRAKVSFPGGCVFGPRPIDLHLRGLRALGADLELESGYIVGDGRKLGGGEMYLGGPFGSTVTGTANVLMAAVLAPGTTLIDMAACEPEVQDLAHFLVAMGAKIRGIGTPTLEVEGVKELGGATYRPVPDRIEAGTFLAAAAITGGNVKVTGCRPDHLRSFTERLVAVGCRVQSGADWVSCARHSRLRAADLTTLPYPGFPTDLQAQFMSLLCLADGVSVVTEKIYPERFMHISELQRMRAQIRKEGDCAIVHGTDYLSGAPVLASDLRASAALVLAGLVAEGSTTVRRIYHLDRGYEQMETKLQRLGARIERRRDEREDRDAEAA
jgi:UDP-N-acetylglucosamine 1-carboxyvinyltransferase